MFAMHDKLVLRFAAMMFIYNQPTFLVMLFLKVISYYLTKAVPCKRNIFIHRNYNRAFKRLIPFSFFLTFVTYNCLCTLAIKYIQTYCNHLVLFLRKYII